MFASIFRLFVFFSTSLQTNTEKMSHKQQELYFSEDDDYADYDDDDRYAPTYVVPTKQKKPAKASSKQKQQTTTTITSNVEEEEEKQQALVAAAKPQQHLVTSQKIFARIDWDKSIPKDDIVIGYMDRFLGMQEIPFLEFKSQDEIVFHRVWYFRYKV